MILTDVQDRLPKMFMIPLLLLVCAACLFLSSCPGSSGSTKTKQPGPAVQIVETTGDQTMLLQSQPSVSFASGGSSSGLVITVDASTQ
ncbi:MAG: hypothetical protein ABSF93_09495, partial [Candidatus Sulfotelmatobacter sp.]